MNAQVLAWMGRQDGLVLRRQALEAGMTVEAVGKLVRGGEWVVVRRGVYTTAARWETLDEYHGRPLLQDQAASRNMRLPHVWSHDSSARLHALPFLEGRPRQTHITRFGALGGRTRHGVKHHKAPFAPEQIVEIGGYAALDLPRTAMDIAREHGLRHGLPAADAALRAGASRASLLAVVEQMSCWPHVTVARRAAELADGRAETVGESLARLLAIGLGIGPVHPQFGLRDQGREAWCDLRVGRHIIEFDGRVKYQTVAQGGCASKSPEEVLWDEKVRQDFITGFKLGMSRIVWDDTLPHQWAATSARVLRECLATNARFGTSIDDLAPYIVEKQRPFVRL